MIKFFRGLKSAYQVDTHGSGIYFATDTKEILHNGNSYVGELPDKLKILDVNLNDDGSKLVITNIDGSTKEIEVGSGSYTSAIEDKELTMPNAVGGIAKGTKLSDIEGKSYDAIFDDLLFPTVNPTFTAPSASINLGGKTSYTLEVGTDISALVPDVDVTFNKGAINLNGAKQNDRSGELDVSKSFHFYNGVSTNTSFPAQATVGDHTITYRAYYEQGPQPKDNKGNDYSTPLASGHVDSNKITINCTYPWYASTGENGVAAQSLIKWTSTVGSMSTGNFTLQPSGTTPQVFVLPRQLKTLQMLNTVSNQMETIGTTEWTETTQSGYNNRHTDQTYYVYTYNGAARGSVTLLAKF